MDPVIEVAGLTKVYRTYRKEAGLLGSLRGMVRRRYEETVAASDITFRVGAGELVGFLGPNGAGKTTVLKMLSGLLFPTRGGATVMGYRPWERKDAFRRRFSLVMGQKNQLWWDLPASDSLELNRVIYGIGTAEARRTIDELTEWLDVRDKLRVMVRELSLGERMKFELIAALLHRPEVLFLDEPTIGLDVVSHKKVREFLSDYARKRRITVLLTSHYMRDIEELCHRVLIVDHGRLFFDGPLAEITDRFSSHKMLTLRRDAGLPELDYAALGEVQERDGQKIRLRVPRTGLIAASQRLLEAVQPDDVTIEEVPIEEIIRSVFVAQGELSRGKVESGA